MQNLFPSLYRITNTINPNVVVLCDPSGNRSGFFVRKYIAVSEDTLIFLQTLLRQRMNYVSRINHTSLLTSHHFFYYTLTSNFQLIIQTNQIKGNTLEAFFLQNNILMMDFGSMQSHVECIRSVLVELLTLFVRAGGVDHFIANYQTILVQSIEDSYYLYQNICSFVGHPLIFHGLPVSNKVFLEIYPFMDSQIFNRPPLCRLDWKISQRSFVIVLLSFVLMREIKFKLPSYISAELIDLKSAVFCMQQIKQQWTKFLRTPLIKKKITLFGQHLKIELFQLSYKILIEQSQLSWSQFKNYFFPSHNLIKHAGLASIISQAVWKGIPIYQRKIFFDKNIINTNFNNDTLELQDCELLLMIVLDIGFDNLVIYDNIDQFFQFKQPCNVERQKIWKRILQRYSFFLQSRQQTEVEGNQKNQARSMLAVSDKLLKVSSAFRLNNNNKYVLSINKWIQQLKLYQNLQ